MIKFQFGFLLIVALVFTVGCSNDSSDLGGSVFPSSDDFKVEKVTLKPSYFSQFHPKYIRTDNQDDLAFGGFYHDEFGSVVADFATQFKFDTLYFSDDDADQLDSIKLHILTSHIFGDSFAINELKVFSLKTPLENGSSYNSDIKESDLYDVSDQIGFKSYRAGVYSEEDSKMYYDSTTGDSLELFELIVPIDVEFGKQIIGDYDKYGPDIDRTERIEAFQNVFKGVYVKSTFGNKAQSTVVLEPPSDAQLYTAMELFFSTKDSGVVFTQNFYVNNECAHLGLFHYDFPAASSESYFDTASVNVSPEFVRMRGLGALNMRMQLPDLRNLQEFDWMKTDSDFIVNSAIITLKIAKEKFDLEELAVPAYIGARADNDSVFVELIETTDNYIGGAYNSTTQEYTLNVTKYVQEILKNNKSDRNDLIISDIDEVVAPYYSIFYGKDSVDIEIIYTRY